MPFLPHTPFHPRTNRLEGKFNQREIRRLKSIPSRQDEKQRWTILSPMDGATGFLLVLPDKLTQLL